MITNESGIHTFSLKLQCKYSEIQNIIEQNECICTGKGKLGLSPYYQMPQFKDVGVDRRLKEFKLSRCDLTCNLYYERKADVQDRIDIFKKSFPIPHYSAVKFGKYTNSMKNSKVPISIRGRLRISLKAVHSRSMINPMNLRNDIISLLMIVFSVWNCGLVVRKLPS